MKRGKLQLILGSTWGTNMGQAHAAYLNVIFRLNVGSTWELCILLSYGLEEREKSELDHRV